MATNYSTECLLTAAKELFLARGCAATTVDASCEAALTKGSFHYFFDSKENLGLAGLEWSIRRGVRMLADGPCVRIADPVEKAFAFLQHWEKCSEALEWRVPCGCHLAGTRRDESPRAKSRRGHISGGRGRLRDKASTHRGSILRKATLTASEFADTLLGPIEVPSYSPKCIVIRRAFPRPSGNFDSSLATLAAQHAYFLFPNVY